MPHSVVRYKQSHAQACTFSQSSNKNVHTARLPNYSRFRQNLDVLDE